MRGSTQEQPQRIAGISAELRKDWENAINGKQKDSVRKETLVVSATKGPNVENGHRNSLLPENRELKKWTNLREEKVLEQVQRKCAFLHQQVEGQPSKKAEKAK